VRKAVSCAYTVLKSYLPKVEFANKIVNGELEIARLNSTNGSRHHGKTFSVTTIKRIRIRREVRLASRNILYD
jgi:hypothetical protein